MNIAFLPAETEDTASSRIRCYTIQKTLASNGLSCTIGDGWNSYILFVQKRITYEIMAQAIKAREQGGIIIYDLDDLGPALDYYTKPELLVEMISLADLVTTDTEGHKEYLLSRYPSLNVAIIPDAIDYYPSAPVSNPQVEANPLRVLWFGSIHNIGLFEKYAATLAELPDVEVVVATGTSGIEKYRTAYSSITFVPWSREGFVRTLQTCHLSCLMHDGSEIDRAKSNNKMITSISWGVPAVVSRTPEYEKTAIAAGVEFAVFQNEQELGERIERLRPSLSRRDYLLKAQPVVWKHYSPRSVAILFLQTIKDALAEKKLRIFQQQMQVPVPPATAATVQRKKPPERDYLRDRVNPEGRDYRLGVYERQRQGGAKPLISNPTIDEIRLALRAHSPLSVLEVGCGRGRIMEELVDEFDMAGCDISEDMLKLCPPHLRVFRYDIIAQNHSLLKAHQNRWDIIFTRGVTMYFMENPVQMAYAMNNLLMLAGKKIIVWEHQKVCDRMREFSSSRKFEYRPIEQRSE